MRYWDGGAICNDDIISSIIGLMEGKVIEIRRDVVSGATV